MKAITYKSYGSPEVLQLTEIDKPIPGENEVLVKINATTVNSADCRLRKADPFLIRLIFGLFKPRKQVLGMGLSGVVEETGRNVTLFQKGDQIFGSTELLMGTYAEYISVPENTPLSKIPQGWSFEEAVAVPFGTHTALCFLKMADIKPGQKVLIYGASGAVGTAAVQLAKYFGAEVTAVCSTSNLEMLKSMGADQVLDYTCEDLSKIDKKWDVVFETVNKISIGTIARLVKKGGVLILGSALIKEMMQGLWMSMTKKFRIIMGTNKPTFADMDTLRQLMESGAIKPVIDRVYSLDEMVEAHRYVDSGRKKGNVVIRIDV
ncbi:NAD(P)-dependent alcohol dehydrogenase [Alkalitalea saponilacus]|uniref:NADPH:quinone reductase n=1 Tax=Alkalitalea saponilacus TaxID=889453 RepID=A0A1T5DXP3_9BACT|nr:NAD(P)-dependent alcohol dehydrogenase [Alkalitalea saponilacus]ASB49158.1 NAD(P)-dependent alcohol dehydrogenase [Alkalitalea saponilacus]SKB76283.1 NADPH:quinone reductase [Alkalitalea saponilacus]